MGKKLNIFMGLCAYLLAIAPYAWAQIDCDYAAFLESPIESALDITRSVSKGSLQDVDLQDVAQEVAIAVFTGTYDQNRAFRPWVHSVAGRRIKDQLRKNGRKKRIIQSDVVGAEGTSLIEDTAVNRAERISQDQWQSPEVRKLRRIALEELQRSFPPDVVEAAKAKLMLQSLLNYELEGNNIREDKKGASLLLENTLASYQLWEQGHQFSEITAKLGIDSKTTSDTLNYFKKKAEALAQSRMGTLSAEEARFLTDNWHRMEAVERILWNKENGFAATEGFHDLRSLLKKIVSTEFDHRPVGMRIPVNKPPLEKPHPWATDRQIILDYLDGATKRSISSAHSVGHSVVKRALRDFRQLLVDRVQAGEIRLSESEVKLLFSMAPDWEQLDSLFGSPNRGKPKVDAMKSAVRNLVAKAEQASSGEKVFSITRSGKSGNLDQAVLRALVSGKSLLDVAKELGIRPYRLTSRLSNLREFVSYEARMRGIDLSQIPGYRDDMSIEDLVPLIFGYKPKLQGQYSNNLVFRASLTGESGAQAAQRLGIDRLTFNNQLSAARQKLLRAAIRANLASEGTPTNAIPWDALFPQGIPE